MGAALREFITWKNYAESKGVKVLDLGYVEEEFKRKIFMSSDILAMPSITDAYGIVYLESWICGKPVIGAKTPVMAEIIRDGIDGYLIKFGDIEELANKFYISKK